MTKSRLTIIREALQIDSKNRFAELLGIEVQKIYDMERNRQKINETIASLLEDSFGINFRYSMTGEGEIFKNKIVSRQNNNDLCFNIPFLKNNVSAGPGITAEAKIINEYIGICEDFITKNIKSDPAKLIAMLVKGDSMTPTLQDNDIVLVDTSIENLRDNKIFIIQLGDELLIKRSFKQDETTYIFESDNEKYKHLLVSTSINFKLIGEIKTIIRNI